MTFFQGRHTDGQQARDKMLGVTNQNRYEIPPTPVRLAVINKTQNKTKQKVLARMWRKRHLGRHW